MAGSVLPTPSAPQALGPYSVAVASNGFIFLSGQVALNPQGSPPQMHDVRAQTRQIMANLTSILRDVGKTFADVVKTTIFMVSMDDYAAINEIYAEYFTDNFPARSAVEVSALPGGFRVEIEMVVG